jgi:hypothetical protein
MNAKDNSNSFWSALTSLIGRGFANSGHSVRKHLYRKVKHCDDARTRFTKRLGDAQGNDIFKYMLILNCIDCQSYVAELREAQKIAAGLFVNGLSGSASQDNEQTTEILPFVRSTERAYPTAKEATIQAGPGG